jgi:hypothetical protein
VTRGYSDITEGLKGKRRDIRVWKTCYRRHITLARLVQLLNMYTGQQDVDSNRFSSADAKC